MAKATISNLNGLRTCIKASDLISNFNPKELVCKPTKKCAIRLKYQAHTKFDVAVKIFNTFMIRCLRESINGYTVFLNSTGTNKIVPIKYGMDLLEKLTENNKFTEFDFLKTNFSIYMPTLACKRRNGWYNSYFYFPEKMRGEIEQANYEKKKINGKILTRDDIVRMIQEESFDAISFISIKKIVHMGLCSLMGCLMNGYRIGFGSGNDQVFIGFSKNGKFHEFLRKFSLRERKGIIKYNGYFYFAKGQKYMYKYPEMCDMIGSRYKDCYRLKMDIRDELFLKIEDYDTTNAELVRKGIGYRSPSDGPVSRHLRPLRECSINNGIG